MRPGELAGLRVAVWGHGREGRAALAALRLRVPSLVPTLFYAGGSVPIESGSDLQVVARSPTAADLSAFDVVIKSPASVSTGPN